jgi:hypothetical protein
MSSPASIPLSDGVRLRVEPNDDAEIVVRVRKRRSGSSAFAEPAINSKSDDSFLLVSVSTNAPEEAKVQSLLDRFAKDICATFPETTRIHYPQ